MSNIPKVTAGMMAEHVTETKIGFIPVLGQIVGAAMSFGTTLGVLRFVLSKLREAAIKIVQLTVEASKDLELESGPSRASSNPRECVRPTVEDSKDLEFGNGPSGTSQNTWESAANGAMWLWMGVVLGAAMGLTMLFDYSPLLLYVVLALPCLIAILWLYQKT